MIKTVFLTGALFLLISFPLLVLAESSPVLAHIGDQTITLTDFTKQNPVLVSWFGLGAKTDQVQVALESMILNSLLAREARENGLAERPDVALQIERVLASAYLRDQLQQIKMSITEADLKSYYQDNLVQFQNPQRLVVAHILVQSAGEAKSLEHALQQGKAFETLAREHSVDPASSRSGGSLGALLPQQLPEELQQAAADLPLGKVSPIVKSKFGYHLVKVLARPDATYRSYQDVLPELKSKVYEARKEETVKELKQKLFAEYQVAVEIDQLQQLVEGPQATIQAQQVTKGSDLAPAGTRPHLKFLAEAYDLGNIGSKTIKQTSLLVNDGDTDLIIKKVSSNLEGLKGVVAPASLAPGQLGRLTLTFDPKDVKTKMLVGPVVRMVYLESNDIERPVRELEIRANLQN